ncbi:MAG: efflux RND transporter permease subunit [Thermoguttaceae bacterium]|nr:efflux RND transporter permease subunit [Thermoguttaceae bacterium]
MFNTIIRFSLNHRLIVLVFAAVLLCVGITTARRLSVDVLPDLNRPRVVVMAECPGMAPEEVETLVVVPIETYLNGAAGVKALRSSSTAGLATVTVEFDWGAEMGNCRRIVDERLQLSAEQLPEGIVPRMIPTGSMMGQVMYLTLWDDAEELSGMELRSLADWVVRKRILALGGVAEVLVIGGDLKQYQVLADIDQMAKFQVTFSDIEEALRGSNRNVTGGFLTDQGPNELLVRSMGRVDDYRQLQSLVVNPNLVPPIQLRQVASIVEAPAVKVGSSGIYLKNPDGTRTARDSVVLIVEKQPGQDTRELSRRIIDVAADIQRGINLTHPQVKIEPVYEQETFINLAIANVEEALELGAVFILVVLFLFLMNIRITFITMLAIPISIVTTCILFALFGLSVNTMTLGGLTVAVGELVDDAIVDVENIYRRLRENFRRDASARESTLRVVFGASCEIRNSVVYGTVIVVIVFLPVFFLRGMEGRIFAPMGIAYIGSLLASLLVSLTVTPVVAYLILPQKAEKHRDRDSVIFRFSKWCAERAIRFSLAFPKTILFCSLVMAAVAAAVFLTLDRDFVPPFNEGAPQVMISLAPGTSLKTSERVGASVSEELLEIDGIKTVTRKTGRPELDEHAVPVNTSEMVCGVDLQRGRPITEIFADIERVISPEHLPGVVAFYDQPLQHLMAHLRTGTRSKIAIKIRGDDPLLLRRRAARIQKLVSTIPDIGNPRIDPIQKDIPQVRFHLDRQALAAYGLVPETVNSMIETAMRGKVATQILEGKRTIDLLLRASDTYREDLDALARMRIRTPGGRVIPLSEVVTIDRHATGPSRIDHEAGQPQITVQMNPQTRTAVEVKEDIDRALAPYWDELTGDGVYLEMTGLFQSEQESSRRLLLLSALSLMMIVLVLYQMFGSMNMSLQVISVLPLALAGAVAALVVTGQNRSIPNLIGMISLCGIASRNGILIIDHYFHLVRFEGASFDREMIVRAGRDRVAPVMMTSLTAILGLLPITVSPNTPGREILYPIATVIVGGLVTSTLMEFFTRPALFWVFGRNSAAKLVEKERLGDDRLT